MSLRRNIVWDWWDEAGWDANTTMGEGFGLSKKAE
jgi:hypothetical protein